MTSNILDSYIPPIPIAPSTITTPTAATTMEPQIIMKINPLEEITKEIPTDSPVPIIAVSFYYY
jgi:hypothetical protein